MNSKIINKKEIKKLAKRIRVAAEKIMMDRFHTEIIVDGTTDQKDRLVVVNESGYRCIRFDAADGNTLILYHDYCSKDEEWKEYDNFPPVKEIKRRLQLLIDGENVAEEFTIYSDDPKKLQKSCIKIMENCVLADKRREDAEEMELREFLDKKKTEKPKPNTRQQDIELLADQIHDVTVQLFMDSVYKTSIIYGARDQKGRISVFDDGWRFILQFDTEDKEYLMVVFNDIPSAAEIKECLMCLIEDRYNDRFLTICEDKEKLRGRCLQLLDDCICEDKKRRAKQALVDLPKEELQGLLKEEEDPAGDDEKYIFVVESDDDVLGVVQLGYASTEEKAKAMVEFIRKTYGSEEQDIYYYKSYFNVLVSDGKEINF